MVRSVYKQYSVFSINNCFLEGTVFQEINSFKFVHSSAQLFEIYTRLGAHSDLFFENERLGKSYPRFVSIRHRKL